MASNNNNQSKIYNVKNYIMISKLELWGFYSFFFFSFWIFTRGAVFNVAEAEAWLAGPKAWFAGPKALLAEPEALLAGPSPEDRLTRPG